MDCANSHIRASETQVPTTERSAYFSPRPHHRFSNSAKNAYLIDVREPDEVLQGMIPSAVNLPLSDLSGALHMDGAKFKEKYGFQKPEFGQEVVFYCRSGKRSATASDVARRNGYKKYAYSNADSTTCINMPYSQYLQLYRVLVRLDGEGEQAIDVAFPISVLPTNVTVIALRGPRQ